MGCPHVRGDNPRALASGLSYVQVDKHTYIGVNVAYLEIFRGKVGTCKGGGYKNTLAIQRCLHYDVDSYHSIT